MSNNFPSNSVLIIHDLELWWERSKEGFKVIDEIISLVDTLSSKCFFIINCNIHSYNYINRLKSIDEVFIKAIECQPFDAQDIQEIILLRHSSTGLKFQLDKKDEDQISNFKLARLFNSYFNISNGNIGYALYYWISNITNIEKNTFQIRFPQGVSEGALNNLSMEWAVWLQQFILHKNLTPKRFGEISNLDENNFVDAMNNLRRSGFVHELQAGIYTINPYIYPVIVKKFKEMDLL